MKRTMKDGVIFSVFDLARAAGKPYSTTHAHIQKGLLPSPTIVVGSRRFFSEEQFRQILEFFKGAVELSP